MLAMLVQSMLGLGDDEIVSDYFESNQLREASAALDTVRKTGRLDRNVFSGTNRQAMVDTLRFLRTKYGSVSPGYLDAIGFGAPWRERLLDVLRRPPSSYSSRL